MAIDWAKWKCRFRGHDWVYGDAASFNARLAFPKRKCYHNRYCPLCDTHERNADVTNTDYENFLEVQRGI